MPVAPGQTLGAVEVGPYFDMIATLQAGDALGIDRMVKEGDVKRLEPLTPVVVVQVRESGRRGVPRIAVVTVLDGPSKGERLFVPQDSLGVFVERAARKKAAAPPPASDAKARANRASTQLRAAQNLEKLKKTAAALAAYRKVTADFPGTPKAAAAAERVKALEPKKP
jgi:hypothetical protein